MDVYKSVGKDYFSLNLDVGIGRRFGFKIQWEKILYEFKSLSGTIRVAGTGFEPATFGL